MEESWARELFDAWRNTEAWTAKAEASISIEEAYATQRSLIQLRGEPIAGYKAGLTSKAAQQAQGLDAPVSGILVESARRTPEEMIQTSWFVTAFIETEIGFCVGADVTRDVTADDVGDVLSHWKPMIELVDVGFSQRPIGTDLIASNVAAAYFIESDYEHDIATVNDASVQLFAGSELKYAGAATDVLGNQLESAAWLINHTRAKGYEVRAGHILMTGSIGAACLARPGDYCANYGEFGDIRFTFAR